MYILCNRQQMLRPCKAHAMQHMLRLDPDQPRHPRDVVMGGRNCSGVSCSSASKTWRLWHAYECEGVQAKPI